jgi:hypothetical protein
MRSTAEVTTGVTTESTAGTPQDRYADPVSYLAEHGIEAALVAIIDPPIPVAA